MHVDLEIAPSPNGTDGDSGERMFDIRSAARVNVGRRRRQPPSYRRPARQVVARPDQAPSLSRDGRTDPRITARKYTPSVCRRTSPGSSACPSSISRSTVTSSGRPGVTGPRRSGPVGSAGLALARSRHAADRRTRVSHQAGLRLGAGRRIGDRREQRSRCRAADHARRSVVLEWVVSASGWRPDHVVLQWVGTRRRCAPCRQSGCVVAAASRVSRDLGGRPSRAGVAGDELWSLLCNGAARLAGLGIIVGIAGCGCRCCGRCRLARARATPPSWSTDMRIGFIGNRTTTRSCWRAACGAAGTTFASSSMRIARSIDPNSAMPIVSHPYPDRIRSDARAARAMCVFQK